MKKLHLALLLLGMLVFAPVAAVNAQQQNPQQKRMTSCNAQAASKALKGPQRQAFMSTCLKGDAPSQQEKMSICNGEASARMLKGEQRRQFMSDCLRKK